MSQKTAAENALPRQFRFWVGGIVVFSLMIWLLKGILLPFILGLAVAYFLDPVVRRLEKHGMNRAVSTSIVLLFFVAAFVMAAALAFPVLREQFIAFAAAAPGYIQKLHTMALPWIDRLHEQLMATPQEDLRKQAGTVASTAFSWGTDVLKGIWQGGTALFDLVTVLLISPVVSFYMLRDWPVMVEKVNGWLPKAHAKTIRQLVSEMDSALSGFVRGQAIVCVTLGAIYAVALTIFGLNFGVLIGFIAGILSFIPYVGSLIGFGTALVVAYFQFDGAMAQLLIVAAIFGAGQFFEGNVLTPNLVGEKVGLHALWILFALMAGGTLMGFTGVMIAVPAAAVIGVLVRFGIGQYLKSGYYNDGKAAKA